MSKEAHDMLSMKLVENTAKLVDKRWDFATIPNCGQGLRRPHKL